MFKQIIISTILIVGVLASTAVAQKSAQASMKVSVEVVEGASVAMDQPNKVSLSENGDSIIGAVSLSGKNNTLVNVADQLDLFNANGNQIKLNVTTEKDAKTNTDSIRFHGLKSHNDTEKGSYSGELRTTVEYL